MLTTKFVCYSWPKVGVAGLKAVGYSADLHRPANCSGMQNCYCRKYGLKQLTTLILTSIHSSPILCRPQPTTLCWVLLLASNAHAHRQTNNNRHVFPSVIKQNKHQVKWCRGQQPESLTLTEGNKLESSEVTGLCTEDDEATLLTDEGPETEGTFNPRIKIRIYNAVSTVKKTQLSQKNLARRICATKAMTLLTSLKTPLPYVTRSNDVVQRL